MPIAIDIEKDVKNAVSEIIKPLFEKIEELNKKLEYATDEYLTEKEVLQILKISASTLRRGYEAGEIPKPKKIGMQNRWLKSEILNYLHSK